MSASASNPRARRILEVLLRSGKLTRDDGEAALLRVHRTGEPVEEVVLDGSNLGEAELLKALAAHYKTQFVTTEKLARADIDQVTLSKLPRRFAEALGVLPVLWDARTSTLSVVMAEPDNLQTMSEVQLASGAREVKAFVGRPAAVRAAIARAYAGDTQAFAALEQQAYQRKLHLSFESAERGTGSATTSALGSAKRPASEPKAAVARAAPSLAPERPNPLARGLRRGDAPKPVLSLPPPVAGTPASVTSPERSKAQGEPPKNAGGASSETMKKSAGDGLSGDAYLELLNVMVGLLESDRKELRGHSMQVAKLVRRVCEKLRLDKVQSVALIAAGYLHDLGKTGSHHLTALACGEFEAARTAAQKVSLTPSRLLEPARLSPETVSAIAHMYERWDGTGFPENLRGKDIPLGARILAIADTFSDLTQNGRNPYRRTLSPREACAVLAKYKETLFDPNLVDLLRQIVMGEDLRARLLATRGEAMLIDTDPEEMAVLELRLVEQGFVVRTARTAEGALEQLARGDVELVVSELDLPDHDGLWLLEQARAQPWGKDLGWVVHTRRQARSDTERAFELGVLDYVTKPANVSVLAAKLKALLEQRSAAQATRGVSGSLREMGLPELVQVLSHGRKTGRLEVRSGAETGDVDFLDGAIVNASWGPIRGEEAFYALAALPDGDFKIDPAHRPTSRVIDQSSESLLLEAMRRMDEAGAERAHAG